MKRFCEVYASTRRDGMYLFVERADGLKRVPEALLERFGRPRHALSFVLDRDRRLARVDAGALIEALDRQGFFLQLPPALPEAPPGGTGQPHD